MLKNIKAGRFVWFDITLTLAVLGLMACFGYGLRALWLCGICIAASAAAEFICLRVGNRKFNADDLLCVSDALIIALMLPAAINWKIPVIACIFAVVIAKNILGGRKNIIFSPAAVAYIFMLTSWENDLLSYPKIYEKTGIFESAGELVKSASYTFISTGKMSAEDYEILMGSVAGPMGTGSALLLAVAAVVLLLRRGISAGAFFGTILGTAFLAYICPVSSNALNSMKYALASNMTLFAAIYIVSDKRTAPSENYYAFFYGLFIAVVSYGSMIITGKENVIVIISVLAAPISLALRNFEGKIKAAYSVKGACTNEKA